VKLLENTFRSVNIGLINEITMMSHRLGIDIWEVIEAAKTKPFGFMAFYPGPGLGGHCLPIDPLYLSWKSRLHGYEAKMIELASSINEMMPHYVVERITDLLNRKATPLKKAAILVVGAAYKRNVDDLRESPALQVIEELLSRGSKVTYTDPFIPVLNAGGLKFRSEKLSPSLLKKQQCVVVLTDHDAFDYARVIRHSKMILDTRNILRKFSPKPHLFFL
jgi:UDP-N-acetyl-D-glucosamine dehydrogenase